MAGSAHVAILMGTCNGARFLRAQLDTVAAQSHRGWRLLVSDDGSGDATPAILAAFRDRHGPERVEIRQGPRRGFAANYPRARRRPGDRGRLLRLRRPGRPLAP